MEPETGATQGMVDELRRRKVLRSTTIYAVCGWCVLQWSDVLFERLGWPEWCVTLVLTVVVLGFPATVALAWVFDLTPRGLRRSDPSHLLVGRRTASSWVVDVLIALLFFSTLYMLFQEGAGI